MTSTIRCFDRVLVKGCLSPAWADAMKSLLVGNGLRMKVVGRFGN
jgi:hypothetical protein